jgi:hypothetical protein
MRVEALPDPLVVDASVGLKWVVDDRGGLPRRRPGAASQLATTPPSTASILNAAAISARV